MDLPPKRVPDLWFSHRHQFGTLQKSSGKYIESIRNGFKGLVGKKFNLAVCNYNLNKVYGYTKDLN